MRSRCSTSRGVSSRGNKRNCFADFLSEGGREGKRITMTSTLTPWRDKLGHALILLLLAATSAFGSGSYTARRFDVYATIKGGGVLDVRETIQFEFQSGTMSMVWREIPSWRTDGIEILDASMDGAAAQPEVRRGVRTRVEWHFPPAGPSTHTFVLHYLVHGVVYRQGDRDVLRWRALPTEHGYWIDASRITIHATVPHADSPTVEAHRAVVNYSRPIPAGGVDIDAGPIRPNGWIIADVRFTAGQIAATEPQWQQHLDDVAALGPRWAITGAAVFLIGVLIAALARRGYPVPSIRPDETTTIEPPSALPAAVAAVLANNGRVPQFTAPVTLIDLADRGLLTISELPRRLGARNFEIAQVPGTHDLEEHEAAALMIAFSEESGPVTLNKARARLARKRRDYRHSLVSDLLEHGFIDPARQAAQDRVTRVAITCLILALLACAGAAAFVPIYGGWTFFVPAGLGIAGIAGLLIAASMTPLTDPALVEAARWRGYRRHLKAAATDPDLLMPEGVPSRWIIYGVALGLAQQWSRYLRKHPGAAPAWCVTLQDDAGAFAALIGSHGAGAAGGTGAAAAGGGSSGAA
jgi:Predicted membrane protein (DUF2207) C-terminal domain/Predicted membrane protein (DUF2207) N-terminal domain